ncbi:ferric reductase transmembrane component 4 [Apiospora phragmitis]|uniref:Ferric reductase transmembrane component 4 n=1 Tax=Apiospora phragmitis TaxID=2905665 RepID=A0ABR1WWA3_9PEZI
MTPSIFLFALGVPVRGSQGRSDKNVSYQRSLVYEKIRAYNSPCIETCCRRSNGSLEKLPPDEDPNPWTRNDFLSPTIVAFRSATKLNGDAQFRQAKDRAGRFGIALLGTGILVPIFLSLFRLLPLSPSLSSRIFAHIIDSPVLGSHHAVPILGLGVVPTRGQALFIACLWLANIVLSTVAYPASVPKEELISLLGHRVGLFSFVDLALSVLYSSRNSALLHLTDWSHSTFLLLHRWTAVISILQACLHSGIYLQKYHNGIREAAVVTPKGYLIWGIITLVALAILIPSSTLPFRRRAYEAFLASHIALVALALVGCCMHIFYRYGWRWEYQAWIVAAFGVWGFDRLLARPLRIFRNRLLREARVSVVDPYYLMVEVPGVDAEGHAYLYFPSLRWRIWENHPFSVAAVGSSARSGLLPDQDSNAPSPEHEEKNGALVSNAPAALFGPLPEASESGLCCGWSGDHGDATPYQEEHIVIWEDRTVLGVRSAALVKAVAKVVGHAVDGTSTNMLWGHTNVSILVGMRFDFKSVLEDVARRMSGGTAVAVCGPPGMADEVRSIVVGLGKRGLAVKFREESFAC